MYKFIHFSPKKTISDNCYLQKNSYARAVNEMLHMPSAFTGRSPQQRILFDRQTNVSASTPSTPQGTLSDRDGRDREHKFESLYATAQHNHNHRVVTKPQASMMCFKPHCLMKWKKHIFYESQKSGRRRITLVHRKCRIQEILVLLFKFFRDLKNDNF